MSRFSVTSPLAVPCAACNEPLGSDLFEPLWQATPGGTVSPVSVLRLTAFESADGLRAWHHGCLPADKRPSPRPPSADSAAELHGPSSFAA